MILASVVSLQNYTRTTYRQKDDIIMTIAELWNAIAMFSWISIMCLYAWTIDTTKPMKKSFLSQNYRN